MHLANPLTANIIHKNAVALIYLLLLTSCFKEVDKSSLNAGCTDSCTIVQGRFLTGGNAPLANIPINIQSEFRPTFGIGVNSIRKIASGKTDNNGNYFFKFSLTPYEYGSQAQQLVSLYFNYDKNKFLTLYRYNLGGDCLCGLKRKDTKITMNYFLTERTKIKVRLENFSPVVGDDNFSVVTFCASGLNRQDGIGDILEASSTTTEKEIDACGNEQTKIYTRKKKNGINTERDTMVYTPVGQTVTVKFYY